MLFMTSCGLLILLGWLNDLWYEESYFHGNFNPEHMIKYCCNSLSQDFESSTPCDYLNTVMGFF